jgi:hypothetical protein
MHRGIFVSCNEHLGTTLVGDSVFDNRLLELWFLKSWQIHLENAF